MPKHRRRWFRISEIADVCAQIPNGVQLDEGKRERAIELLRKAIFTGEFEDTDGRSRVANLHQAFAAELRFARDSGAEPKYFRPCAPYLWIRRVDCEAWFRRNGIEFPKGWVTDSTVNPTELGLVTSRRRGGRQSMRVKDALKEIFPDGLPSEKEWSNNAIVKELKLFFVKNKWRGPPDRRTTIRVLGELRPAAIPKVIPGRHLGQKPSCP
jgi:hypothetical protein